MSKVAMDVDKGVGAIDRIEVARFVGFVVEVDFAAEFTFFVKLEVGKFSCKELLGFVGNWVVFNWDV